jgi:hypothetical protein
MRGVLIATRAGVDTDPWPISAGKAVEHVQLDRRVQQSASWIEL